MVSDDEQQSFERVTLGALGAPAGLNRPPTWCSHPCAAAAGPRAQPQLLPWPQPFPELGLHSRSTLPRGLARLTWAGFSTSPCLTTAGLSPEPVIITRLALFGCI